MWVSVQRSRARLGIVFLAALACPKLVGCSQGSQPREQTNSADAQSSGLAQAKILFQEGRLAEADTAIADYLRLHPSSVDAYNLLGIIRSNERNYPAALDAFQHALTLDSRSTKTHNNLANLYASAGKNELAEAEFRKTLAIAPSDRDANYNLALLLMEKGSPVTAISYFQRVRPATLESRLNLVRAYLRANQITEGLKLAGELSDENKEGVQRHFTLGVLLAAEKQYKPAELEL